MLTLNNLRNDGVHDAVHHNLLFALVLLYDPELIDLCLQFSTPLYIKACMRANNYLYYN